MHLRLIQEVVQYKMIVFSIADYMKKEGSEVLANLVQ
jgi:hypothetical protein